MENFEEYFSKYLTLKNKKFQPDKKYLIIFDLNNVLVSRVQSKFFDTTKEYLIEPTELNNFYCWKRKGLDKFLEWVFKNFKVGIWSSAKKHNTDKIVKFITDKQPVLVYNQSNCGIEKHPETDRKPLFLKNLSTVFEEYPEYDKSNTILIDDSVLKCKNNPEGCSFNPSKWEYSDNSYNSDTGLDEIKTYLKEIIN